MMDANHSLEERNDRIAEHFAAEIRARKQPVIAEYLAKYDDPDGSLEELLHSIAMIENLKLQEMEPSGSDAPKGLRLLDQIDDYKVVREIGRGGMGVVYEAIHQSLERRVALKVLSSSLLGNAKHVTRFRREARAAARLRHPNIVPVFGVGSTDEHHYYVMDLIEGKSLRNHIQSTITTSQSFSPTMAGSDFDGESGFSVAEELEVPGRNERGSEATQTMPVPPLSPARPGDRSPTIKLPSNESRTRPSAAPPDVSPTFQKPLDLRRVSDSSNANPKSEANSGLEGSGSSSGSEHSGSFSSFKLPVSAKKPIRPSAAGYFDWVAQTGATISDALHYAHSQGVLHRDIKPGNLLLDRAGGIWIADFGLAKLSEQNDVTKSGEVLGTPQYLPPESFDGKYDVRSEVYCVALTIYELLALQPAIQGETAAATLRNASQGVSQSPNKLNPKIPRDLETVVMKALSKLPEHRYATVGELGEDLKRFCSGHPISARRVGLSERVVRWCYREPLIATFSLTTLLLVSSLAIVSGLAYWRTKGALENEKQSLAKAVKASQAAEEALEMKSTALSYADEQRELAQKNLQTALDAFDQIMQKMLDRGFEIDAEILGETSGTTAANVSPEDAEILRTLLIFFDELAKNNSQDLLFESAKAAHVAGDIYASLGQLSRSQIPYLAAKQRYRKLCEREPDNVECLAAYADLMNDMMAISSLTGQLGKTFNQFREATEFLESFDITLEHPETRFQLARTYRLRASLGAQLGFDNMQTKRGPIGAALGFKNRLRNSEDLKLLNQSMEILEQLQAEATAERKSTGKLALSSNEERCMAELARVYRSLAQVESRSGRNLASERALKQAIDLQDELLRKNPESDGLRYELAITLLNSRAEPNLQSARTQRVERLSSDLLSRAPEFTRYRALRSQAFKMAGDLSQQKKDLERAETLYWQAVRGYSSLLAESPEIKAYQIRRALTFEAIAKLKVSKQEYDEAIALLQRALRRNQPKPGPRREASAFERRVLDRLSRELERLEAEVSKSAK